VYRFRTRHRCYDLRIGRISRLRKRSRFVLCVPGFVPTI
jgi:hypothetical protein